jgi:hypothetical protein
MTSRTGNFAVRLSLSLKTAIEGLSAFDAISMNQSVVVAAAEKLAAMQAEGFFDTCRTRVDRGAFLHLLDREGGIIAVATTASTQWPWRLTVSRQ